MVLVFLLLESPLSGISLILTYGSLDKTRKSMLDVLDRLSGDSDTAESSYNLQGFGSDPDSIRSVDPDTGSYSESG
jgi:hypothetical protein